MSSRGRGPIRGVTDEELAMLIVTQNVEFVLTQRISASCELRKSTCDDFIVADAADRLATHDLKMRSPMTERR